MELVLPVSLSSGPSQQNPSFGALLVGSFIRFRPVGNGMISVENDNLSEKSKKNTEVENMEQTNIDGRFEE